MPRNHECWWWTTVSLLLSPRRLPWAAQYPRDVNWLLDIPVRPVYALLDDAVAAFPERPFLDFLGRRQSYAQAAQLIARAAAGFQRRLGVCKGTKGRASATKLSLQRDLLLRDPEKSAARW